MMPTRMWGRRAQSRPCLHRDVALTACDGEVDVQIVTSAVRSFEALVVYRCYRCARGSVVRAIEVMGVLPDAEPSWQDTEDDVDGYDGGECWLG